MKLLVVCAVQQSEKSYVAEPIGLRKSPTSSGVALWNCPHIDHHTSICLLLKSVADSRNIQQRASRVCREDTVSTSIERW